MSSLITTFPISRGITNLVLPPTAFLSISVASMTAPGSMPGRVVGSPAEDSSWHGTHVAGTIGAATDNGKGVAGVNWRAGIVPVRALGRCGGYTSDIIDGMLWAAGFDVPGVPLNRNPARVLNLSIGGRGACLDSEQQAIDRIVQAGTVIVVAAGNSNEDAGGFSRKKEYWVMMALARILDQTGIYPLEALEAAIAMQPRFTEQNLAALEAAQGILIGES